MVEYPEWDPDQALANMTMEKTLEGLDNNIAVAKRLFEENLPLSVMSICHLAVNSANEGIRFNAAKYVVDRTMGPADKSATPDGHEAWKAVFDSVLTEAEGYLSRED
jgi:hypothetical protein